MTKGIACQCEKCGADIPLSEYAGYPFCFDCRQAYRRRKFNDITGDGERYKKILYHLPAAPGCIAPLCGQSFGKAYECTLRDAERKPDKYTLCVKCERAQKK